MDYWVGVECVLINFLFFLFIGLLLKGGCIRLYVIGY